MQSDGCVNTSLTTVIILQCLCIYQIFTVYTLSLLNIICQLCVSKMGDIKQKKKKCTTDVSYFK